MKRIGMLTSGGDCQALNATMRGIAKGLYELFNEVEIYGFLEGYKGLIRGNYIKMKPADFSGIINKGGTILGSSRQPFKLMGEPTEDGLDKVKSMKDTYKKLKLDCLCVLGGNGSQKTANLLSEEGLNVIGIATQTIDCIHTTAASHNRIFIVEIMGHKVGWITLHAGIAGGADVILLPEIPYDINKVVEAIQKRNKAGKRFTILAVAEGAISKEDAELPKKKYKEKLAERAKKYPSVSYEIADQIQQVTGSEVRITVPGHMQRGGEPCAYDRVLSTRIGAGAAQAIMDEEYGVMIGVINGKIKRVPLAECAGKLKMVSPDDQLIKEAKCIGISFGV